MCGINGFVDFKAQYACEQRHNIIHEMNQKITYRGPDNEGIYDGDWLSMGMRRLAILDLNTGNQPIYNVDDSVIIVFNGEIYNYRKLKRKLIDKGYSFITNTDTEVILHLYEEYGIECFSMLDGMFAIAIYDDKKRSITLVRDRMGEKPLYYYRDDSVFCFASEMKSMIAAGVIEKHIDYTALNLFLQYTYIPAPYTIFKNVLKLQPGYYIEVNVEGKMQTAQYWNLQITEEFSTVSYKEAICELQRRLNSSVIDRMNCDVSYGAFLSGGIDSSIIASLMARNSVRQINTFTIGFEEAEYDESKNARQVADYIGSSHHECIMKYRDAVKIIGEIISNMDEPFGDSSAIPEYLVAAYASKYAKVVLTGDAGDECFLGYDKYLISYYVKKYQMIPRVFREGIIEPFVKKIPDKTATSRKINKVIQNVDNDMFASRNRMMQLGFKDSELLKLLKPELFDISGQSIIKDYYNKTNGTELQKTQMTDLKIVLEGDMLTKVDRMCMLNSIEARTPMLANDVVQFAFSLPDIYKINGKNKKRILKDAFSELLLPDFTKLPKTGFGIPLDYWFRNEMKEELTDLLSKEKIVRENYFNYVYIEHLLKEHFSGKVNRKGELWNLYVFEKWIENYGK